MSRLIPDAHKQSKVKIFKLRSMAGDVADDGYARFCAKPSGQAGSPGGLSAYNPLTAQKPSE
jgi:hypothetical protein